MTNGHQKLLEDSYVQGFCKTAEAAGVDPVELMKMAASWGEIWNGIKSPFVGAWNGLKSIGQGIYNSVTNDQANRRRSFNKGVSNGVSQIGQGISNGFKSFVKGITPESWHNSMRNGMNNLLAKRDQRYQNSMWNENNKLVPSSIKNMPGYMGTRITN